MAKGGKRPGAGRKAGTKNAATLEREAVLAVYRQRIMGAADQLFHSQLALSRGLSFVYRIERHGTGSKERIEHVLLESSYEIADALDAIANGEQGFAHEDGYVYISVKAPENRAIDSMLDRALGKVTQGMDLTTNGKDLPTPLLANVLPTNDSTKEGS